MPLSDKLTESAVRVAKPAERAQKLFDGGGLFLLVTPEGARLWRLKYRYAGREKLLALGPLSDSCGAIPSTRLRSFAGRQAMPAEQIGATLATNFAMG